MPSRLTLAQSLVSDAELRYVDNQHVRVGIKPDSGAAIAWISAGEDGPNLVNAHDRGRLIQQSYYGSPDGSVWNKQPWRWNPVQGGDWRGQSSQVLELKVDEQTIYSKTIPKHWATGQDIATTTMEQWIKLDGPLISIKYRFEQRGGESHPAHHQELPAVFVSAKLRNLVYCDAERPWTDQPVTRTVPKWPNEYHKITEHWAAYVDDQDEGLGVYVPAASELTCYRYGKTESAPDACSYFAPLATFAVTSDFTWEYHVYITTGKLTDIRQRFAILAAKEATLESTK